MCVRGSDSQHHVLYACVLAERQKQDVIYGERPSAISFVLTSHPN